jgi:hypothetical protein
VSDPGNLTDVFFTSPARVTSAMAVARGYRAQVSRGADVTTELRARASLNIALRLGAKLTRRPLPMR